MGLAFASNTVDSGYSFVAAGYELPRTAQFNSATKGIYISQPTLEDREYLQYLIKRSIQAGINTFIVDLNVVSAKYERNLILIKNAGIKYVARIVVFPFGSEPENMRSEAYWVSRYRLVKAAIDLGAAEIQLDYIRYAYSSTPADHNSEDVHRVINWFKSKIGDRAKLHIDVFGGSYFNESISTGQNIVRFEPSADSVVHASEEQLHGHVHSQVKALEDASTAGWYAWNTDNQYDRLFNVLSKQH